MTYNTPELLLVGAAQNLVLGVSDGKLGGCGSNFDLGSPAYGDLGMADGASW